MGGFGSGHWIDAMRRRVNTDLCRTLSIRTLKMMGVFDDDSSGEVFSVRWVNEIGEDAGCVNITPQAGGNGNKRSLRVEIGGCVTGGGSSVTGQDISITTTPYFYGGVRYWFLCPAVVDGVLCEDRVGKLYLPPGGKLFGCRQCYGLTYESCRQSHKYDRVMGYLNRLDEDNLTINQVLRLSEL
ncbi:MAG: hypothetical protein J7K65_00255 [Planctomycetes bacterium]|nr:hypothetical protein [Planctomycetota bacterium]